MGEKFQIMIQQKHLVIHHKNLQPELTFKINFN